MATEFKWTQPMGGKPIVWHPLKVRDRMDLDANYSRSDVAWRKKYAEYALRIIRCGDKPDKFQIEDFADWDEFDLEAFAEEVATQEVLRANALSGTRPGSPVERLEAAINAAQVAVGKLGTELQNVLAVAKNNERNAAPLAPTPPTS
jgi:hypothetical protein